MALEDGNALIISPNWVGPEGRQQGAVTLFVGRYDQAQQGYAFNGQPVGTGNSMTGQSANDQFGSGGIFRLPSGEYFINSPLWDHTELVGSTRSAIASNAGAVTRWANASIPPATPQAAPDYIGSIADGQLHGSTLPSARSLDDQRDDSRMLLQTLNTASAGRQLSVVDLMGDATGVTLTYGYQPDDLMTISAASVGGWLSAGTAVRLQASNDIKVDTSIHSTGVGSLTLQAGRSIELNQDITTQGDVELIANDVAANGVVRAAREGGDGGITMAADTTLTARHVTLRVREGLDGDGATAGAITLASVVANSMDIHHARLADEALRFSIGDKVYDGTVTAAESGFNLKSALVDWLKFTSSSAVGPVVQGFTYESPDVTGAPTNLVGGQLALDGITGELRLFRSDTQAVVPDGSGTITPRTVNLSGTKTYDGDGAFDVGAVTLTNRVQGDDLTLSGSLSVNAGNAGTYAYGQLNAPGDLQLAGTRAFNYRFGSDSDVQLAIAPRPIEVTGTKTYDGNGRFDGAWLTAGNVLAQDTLALSGDLALARSAAGAYHYTDILQPQTLQLSDPNYTFGPGSIANLAITARPISLSGLKLYNGNGLFIASQVAPGGLVAGEAVNVTGSLRVGTSAVGRYGIDALLDPGTLGLNNGNYVLDDRSAVNLVIAPAHLATTTVANQAPDPGVEPAAATRVPQGGQRAAAAGLPLAVRGGGINLPPGLGNQ